MVVESSEHELGFTRVEFDILLRQSTGDAKQAVSYESLISKVMGMDEITNGGYGRGQNFKNINIKWPSGGQ